MQQGEWSEPVADQEAWARAGGRRHYNAWRRSMALYRQMKIVEFAGASGLGLWRRGVQTVIARRFGIHRSTVSRDRQVFLADYQPGKTCPVCGCTARHLWPGQEY